MPHGHKALTLLSNNLATIGVSEYELFNFMFSTFYVRNIFLNSFSSVWDFQPAARCFRRLRRLQGGVNWHLPARRQLPQSPQNDLHHCHQECHQRVSGNPGDVMIMLKIDNTEAATEQFWIWEVFLFDSLLNEETRLWTHYPCSWPTTVIGLCVASYST